MSIPDLKGLEQALHRYTELKAIFEAKKASIPKDILKVLDFKEMKRLKKYAAKKTYLEKVYLLGFKPGKKPYTGIPGSKYTEIQQAADYVLMLFDFEDIIHSMMTRVLQVPKDLTSYLKHKDRFDPSESKEDLLGLYMDYLKHLGE